MKPTKEEIKIACESLREEFTGVYGETWFNILTILAALESAQAMIDLTYKEWCGRDYMHLPLNEAVGAAIDAARKSP
jgi:hypothetical protein